MPEWSGCDTERKRPHSGPSIRRGPATIPGMAFPRRAKPAKSPESKPARQRSPKPSDTLDPATEAAPEADIATSESDTPNTRTNAAQSEDESWL